VVNRVKNLPVVYIEDINFTRLSPCRLNLFIYSFVYLYVSQTEGKQGKEVTEIAKKLIEGFTIAESDEMEAKGKIWKANLIPF
jgi:hypothetical protein